MSDNLIAAANETTARNGKTKITTKDPALKLAHKRLTVLQLAASLGNVSEACRRGGLDRTSFHEYKRRFQTHGIERLTETCYRSIEATRSPRHLKWPRRCWR